jgi:hypothetical protein
MAFHLKMVVVWRLLPMVNIIRRLSDNFANRHARGTVTLAGDVRFFLSFSGLRASTRVRFLPFPGLGFAGDAAPFYFHFLSPFCFLPFFLFSLPVYLFSFLPVFFLLILFLFRCFFFSTDFPFSFFLLRFRFYFLSIFLFLYFTFSSGFLAFLS